MRLPTLSLLLISAVLLGEMHAASAQSPTSYPWCSRSGDGDSYNICYFTSKEQCQGTISGVAAFCFANPYYRPPPPASDEAVNAPRPPGRERYQLPREAGRQVGARQSRGVRAKQSASIGERSPGGRLDASATGAQMPKQETLTGADVGIRPPAALTPELTAADVRPPADPALIVAPKMPELTGADVGIRSPAALTPESTGADVGVRPPADPALIVGPKTPE
jgi:hypothetical protein